MVTRGSEWRRWEPHIHAPGTILNDQFSGQSAWHDYFVAIETAALKVEAIGLTDYCVTDTYEEVLQRRGANRLPNVKLIFPNVELRLGVAAKTGFVNLHLLVSPEDSDPLEQLRRILSRLQFNAFSDRFDCTRSELMRLGRRADPSLVDDRAALSMGATQFKVDFNQLRDVYGESEWARKNILIAVAGGMTDGTSGIRQAADATIRQEIEKFAHIIFASSAAQREFWLGQRSVTVEELRERYNGCKPCLHGSDAHDQASTAQPTANCYSWLKGALTFDALRQACIDPESRAYVAPEPPRSAMPSQVIAQVEIGHASWAATPAIPLNPGLVAIIGARGSGKTALADVIAAGCDANVQSSRHANEDSSPSFLIRAKDLIGAAEVKLTWRGGTAVTRRLDGSDSLEPFAYPRARYLSQQFVEELCSSKGASEGLLQEIQRVIFEAHNEDQCDGATSFAELLQARTKRFRAARARETDALVAISDRIAEEMEKESTVSAITTQVQQKRGDAGRR